MAAPRLQTLVNGVKTLINAITSTAGVADAEKVVATNASGVIDDTLLNAATTGADKTLKTLGDGTIDPSVLPSGVGADTVSATASEILAAGDLVNFWDNAGTASVRKADATAVGKAAQGFVLAGVANGAAATVYLEGRITGLSGLTTGARQYLSAAAPGALTAAPPATAGNVVQFIGVAVSATVVSFEPDDPVTLT